MAGNNTTNGQINVQYGLDASRASAEVAKLNSQITGISANLLQASKTIETNLQRMTADINASLAKAKAGSAQLNALLRREDRVTGNILSSQARGNRGGQLTDASGRSLISDIRNSAENVTARITNELVSAYEQRIRAMDSQVAQRLRRISQRLDPKTIAVNDTLAQRAQSNREYSAANGAGALANRNTLDRLSSNGGADIVAVQARILAGYTALNLAFQGLRNMGTFVVELDKEFRQFQAITATTSTEMVGLKDRLIEVSQASHFSAVEIAKAATILGQAGLSAREVADSIGAVSLLATAAGTDLNEAVDVVTSTMSIFNLQTSQTTDVANTLTAALNLSKLTIDKLTLGFQYAGNIAAQVGVTYQELTGVLGALANSGIRSGSTLGTGLRQLLIDIQNPTDKFKETLKQLKLSEQDVNIESNGLLPVLRTLKDAGFGTAQAFESFEVRAAAAYAALSNNTELASQLQQQFTLTTAAVEANAVQMESLANTYDRFASIIGTLAYKTFDPLIQVLQDALKAVSDFLAVLDKVPGLLEVIGIAITGVVTALALSSLSALIRGLLTAIPVVSTFTGALAGTAGGITAVGGAATAASGVLGVLFAIVTRHPLLLIATALITAFTAFQSFNSEAQDAAARLDTLKAQVNEFRGQIDSANDQVTAINQTIENLIKQKAALDKDPLMRTAKILEVKQAFKEISDQVDSTTGSVEDLINALRNLANTDFTRMSKSIQDALTANRALIDQYRTEIQVQQTQTSPLSVQTADRRLSDLGAMPSGYDAVNGSSLVNDSAIAIGFGNVFGKKFEEYARIALNRMALSPDVTESQQMLSSIGSSQNTLTSRQNILTNKSTLGTITAAEAKELGNISTYLSLLELLKQNLQPLVTNQLNIASTELQNKVLQNDLLSSNVKSAPGYNSLAKDTDALSGDITGKYNALLKSTQGQPVDQVITAFEALETEFSKKVQSLRDRAEILAKGLADQNDVPVDDVRAVLSDVTDSQASLAARISTKVNNENIAFQKLEAERMKEEADTLDDAIGVVKRQLSRAYSQSEIDAIRNYLMQKYDQKRQLTASIFNAKIGAETDTDAVIALQGDLREAQKQINLEEQAAITDVTNASLELKIKIIDDTKAALDDQITATEKKLGELIDSIGKSKPGPAMDALIAQFNTLAAALKLMQGQSNSLEIQSETGSTVGRVIPTGQADKANKAMQVMMSLGYTKQQAAGIVGNLVAESGMSTSARGDNGQAFGLAQWHPDRQKELDQFATDQGTTRYDFETQLRFIDQELKSKAGLGLKELLATRTAGEAADVFRRLFERPSANATTGQHDERIGFANTLAGVDYATQAAEADVRRSNETQAEASARRRAASATSSQTANAATQQIQTLITQAGITTDPGDIKTIIESVNAQYKRVIDEKARIFDIKNFESTDDPETIQSRNDLLEGLRADQNQKISGLLDKYWEALDKRIQEPVVGAQRALANAEANPMNYSGAQITDLQNNVVTTQRDAQAREVAAAEQVLVGVRKELATATKEYGQNSAEANYWLQEEAVALERVNQLTKEKVAGDEAIAATGPTVTAAIQSATEAWAIQNGLIDELTGKMVPLAKQVEATWGQVLDTMTTGFTTLFTDLVKGTMTAEDAFKNFALSVIDSFIQMIAKALAMQIVMSMFGDGGIGSGVGGNLLQGLFGVVGKSANGEIVPGMSNRDSKLRMVMPGEAILRRSAVSALGRDTVTSMNNMGNRAVSGSPMNAMNDNSSGAEKTVNVYVVSPDQIPPLGPNDIVATVADNINRRGTLKTLIKSVAMGA